MEKLPSLMKCVCDLVDSHAYVSHRLTDILQRTQKVVEGEDRALVLADLRDLQAAIKVQEVLCMQAQLILAEPNPHGAPVKSAATDVPGAPADPA